MTIEIPEDLTAALKARAEAEGASLVSFARHVLEQAAGDRGRKPRKSAYGILARFGNGPSEREIDENRREMFSGFGKSVI